MMRFRISGIEGFVGLNNLYAIGHKLETINLDKNIALDTLDLSGNELYATFKS